jgi:hypothetical protein
MSGAMPSDFIMGSPMPRGRDVTLYTEPGPTHRVFSAVAATLSPGRAASGPIWCCRVSRRLEFRDAPAVLRAA